MKIIADMHTHTIASTHAYSTLTEMVHAAAGAGLYAIAITDHGNSMPGAPGKWYFKNLVVVPRFLEGVLVLRGAEANIIDYEGNLDLEQESIDNLDWLVASMHMPTMPREKPTVELCTHAWLNIAKNPKINVIGHSGMERYRYDYDTVIPEFGRNGKLVEINETSFRVRQDAIPNCKKIAQLCKKHGVRVVVDSDAHFHTALGNYPNALQLLKEVDFPEELVVNSSVERLNEYLSEYTSVLAEK